jgi:hypothetical protein
VRAPTQSQQSRTPQVVTEMDWERVGAGGCTAASGRHARHRRQNQQGMPETHDLMMSGIIECAVEASFPVRTLSPEWPPCKRSKYSAGRSGGSFQTRAVSEVPSRAITGAVQPFQMTASNAAGGSAPRPSVPAEVLSMCYRHRLLTTRQIHLLHRPGGARRSAQRVMKGLLAGGLANFVRSMVTDEAVWYLTDQGAAIAESGTGGRPSRYRVTAALAKGPLRQHTLAVNKVGLAFVSAARALGDECSPNDWEHEVALKVTDRRSAGRPWADLCVPDAVLHYAMRRDDGQELLARFVEVDRGTETVVRLAGKLRSYVKLHGYKPNRSVRCRGVGGAGGLARPVPGLPQGPGGVVRPPGAGAGQPSGHAAETERDRPVHEAGRIAGLGQRPRRGDSHHTARIDRGRTVRPIFWTPGSDHPIDVVGDDLT